jgi:hypothetical protein
MGMADVFDADRKHDVELQRQVEELTLKQNPESPVATEERVQKAADILEKFQKEQSSDAHASAMGALYRQTPIGKALLMFLLYRHLAIPPTDTQEEAEANNADDIFPIFVKVMTVVLSRQTTSQTTPNVCLYSQVRFVQRYRRSDAVWHGEPGFGLTNVASFIEYVDRQFHPEGRQLFGNAIISPLSSPPTSAGPQTQTKSGLWLLGQMPSSQRSTPSPIKRAGSSTLVAATAAVTGFAKTLQTQIKKQGSNADMARPPVVDRFVNMSSYRDLKMSDVELLLEEYKKLALWSKTVPADVLRSFQ